MSDTRREALLDVAEALLEREGLDAFGVGTLAREAGIRPPSLYKQFAGLPDIHAALISRGFGYVAADLDRALADAGPAGRDQLEAFVRAYRAAARSRPQLYRLMTARPLDRDRLTPGAELQGMAPLLDLFGETPGSHDHARAAWAWAHGLVSLEIADRFPPDADVEAAWGVLVASLTRLVPGG